MDREMSPPLKADRVCSEPMDTAPLPKATTVAKATNKEDAPPMPLKKATSSGISVISTFLAKKIPIKPPTTRPPTIQGIEALIASTLSPWNWPLKATR